MTDTQKTSTRNKVPAPQRSVGSRGLKHVFAFLLVPGFVAACAQGPDPGEWIPGRVVEIYDVAPNATNIDCPARRAARIDHLRGGTHTTGNAVLSATDKVQVGQRIYFVHMQPCKGLRLSAP